MISCSLLVLPLPEFLSFFQASLAITCSYFLLNYDPSGFWYSKRIYHRIIGWCVRGKHLWWKCNDSVTHRIFIVQISPPDKSVSHVANDVVCFANIDTKWTTFFMGSRHTRTNDFQLYSLVRHFHWCFDLAYFYCSPNQPKIKNHLIKWNSNQTQPKKQKKEYFSVEFFFR